MGAQVPASTVDEALDGDQPALDLTEIIILAEGGTPMEWPAAASPTAQQARAIGSPVGAGHTSGKASTAGRAGALLPALPEAKAAAITSQRRAFEARRAASPLRYRPPRPTTTGDDRA